MSLALRTNLAQKVTTALKSSSINNFPKENLLANALRVDAGNPSSNSITLQLPFRNIFLDGPNKSFKDSIYQGASQLVKYFPTDELIKGISITPVGSKNPAICFNISKNHFIYDLINEALWTKEEDYIKKQLLGSLDQDVVVEFSSPNIAKPFHVGHLRSTIHGNFIANLHQALGFRVTKLNYLGDWGTQFGLLQYGIDQQWYKWEEIQQSPIKLLLEIYIRANTLAEKDGAIAAKARTLFQRLEEGDGKLIEIWSKIRHYAVHELTKMYDRLGVKFDKFEWESQYSIKHISAILQSMEKKSLISTTSEGKKIAQLNNDKMVTLVKSDGSSLYITRDIAAAVDRFDRFKFYRMFYVVDNAQTDHFEALKKILSMLNYSWANRIEHIKFGRIKGMSTRKGTAVFLTDVLDEAYQRMKTKQLSSSTTKVDVDSSPETTNTLALSAVFIHDLKQRRQRDYTFHWDEALKDKGDTGLFLQYAHCRLSSLERRSGVTLSECHGDIDYQLLQEPEMINLVKDIARFRQVISESYEQLESCILVRYLFDLSHSVNSALKTVQIKNQPHQIAKARLAVFSASKRILGMGLKILGITPLDEM